MRFHLLGLVLLAGVAMPAIAQKPETLDRRVGRIEQELRAVQRRVFPNATAPYVAGEIQSQPALPSTSGVPATSAIGDLTARVDALESQLRGMTNQSEENTNRLRLLEQGLAQLRSEYAARLDALERAAAPPAGNAPVGSEPATETDDEPARPATRTATGPTRPPRPQPSTGAADSRPNPTGNGSPPATAAGGGDAAEQAYNAGFRLWEQKRYADAQQALLETGRKYPDSKWASWANNLAGRAYLDDGKPVQAARILLSNYQNNPKGERAADSLFYVGQALMAVGKPEAACKAYDELQDVYGRGLRDYLKQRLPAARAEAKCR
jgi:TolA-binding protein